MDGVESKHLLEHCWTSGASNANILTRLDAKISVTFCNFCMGTLRQSTRDMV
jgi:hypothetical protein